MKPLSGALQTLLATRQFFLVDLYEITLASGTVLRYTGGDADLILSGHTYSAGGQTGPYFSTKQGRPKAHWKVGKDVDTLVFDVLTGSATVAGLSWLQAIAAGVFDEAELTWSVVPMATYGDTSVGATVMFTGRIAAVDVRRSLATFTVASHLEILDQQFPRNLFQAGCLNTLYDASCGLVQGSFTDTGTVLVNSTAGTVLASGLSQASGYYDRGKIKFTSGALNGFFRTVKSWTLATGTIALYWPFPSAPSAGDTFSISAGCDKTLTTCQSKFSNLANNRSTPYIPTPETAA